MEEIQQGNLDYGYLYMNDRRNPNIKMSRAGCGGTCLWESEAGSSEV